MDISRPEPQATVPVDHRDDARAAELNNLKLALATFALQLDAFEMRTRAGSSAARMTPRNPRPGSRRRLQTSAGKELVVNKVTWHQVGGVTEPGRYMFRFGWLTVTADDIAIWEKLPNAAFTLVKTASTTDLADEFRLGAFELQDLPGK